MTREPKYFFCPNCGEKIEWKAWMSGWIRCDECSEYVEISRQKIYLESERMTNTIGKNVILTNKSNPYKKLKAQILSYNFTPENNFAKFTEFLAENGETVTAKDWYYKITGE
jgi:DNA-directed RNA polymerase subunit M/transcription elongation factor TFIIS